MSAPDAPVDVAAEWVRLKSKAVSLKAISPLTISAAVADLNADGLVATTLFVDGSGWGSIAGNAAVYGNLLDPKTRYEDVAAGDLGSLLGLRVLTDSWCDPGRNFLHGSYVA